MTFTGGDGVKKLSKLWHFALAPRNQTSLHRNCSELRIAGPICTRTKLGIKLFSDSLFAFHAFEW